jgi:hypothetical protein
MLKEDHEDDVNPCKVIFLPSTVNVTRQRVIRGVEVNVLESDCAFGT